MLFWSVLAGLTAMALAIVFWPVARGGAAMAARESYDVRIFRDQLAELERDLANGAIDAEAAEAARNEIGRRILAAENKSAPATGTGQTSQTLAMGSLVAIPLIALVAYLSIGRPDLPDTPRAERMAKAEDAGDVPAMIAKVEAHLAANPTDAQGWLVLAPVYRSVNRFSDAADAFRQGLALGGAEPGVLTDYGEVLMLANSGMVTADARQAFDDALKLEPKHPKALYYRALAEQQAGNADTAKQRFTALLRETPKDAPWRQLVVQRLAELSPDGKGPVLDQQTVESAQQMSAEDRRKMIVGMVEGLAERLAADGQDLQGWLRLINARMVLGQKDKAQQALVSARQAFQNDSEALAQLETIRQRHQLNDVQ